MKKACERPDDDKFTAWPLLLEAHGLLVEELEKALVAQGGPPLAWYDVMVQLSSAPEGMLPMKELAESVLLSKSGVTRLVDRMAAAGYVTRDSCPTDRRVVYAKLTDRGREVFDSVRPQHLDDVRRLFTDHLTDTEARAIKNALMKIVSAVRNANGAQEERAEAG
ncbi:MAG TPA: MarR family transcriptional regulator [Actinomycetota bacterium]|nr:MarR family transcriptional regulator [Actinomycetota bacterium]